MKIRVVLCTVLIWVLLWGKAYAIAPAEFAEKCKVNLNDEIPSLTELREQFRPAPVYDRKYKYYWQIGSKFDKDFARTIRSYGTRNRRLKWAGEDELYGMIKNMDPKMYQYIGPYLHTVPGIPEKILNMPGIKETKNKFPTRIAKQVADIEDLEMLSPVFYFLLMPEAWAENSEHEEVVISQKLPQPSNKYDSKLVDDIAEIVRPQDYAPGAVVKRSVAKELRTIKITESSPLTTPDINAFVDTLDELNRFGEDIVVQVRLIEAGGLIESWENAQGKGSGIPGLRDLVYPCARLVQKIKVAGLDDDFKSIIAKRGLGEDEWAYTCDKTIKAYRMLNMTQTEAKALKLYRRNVFGDVLALYDQKYGALVATTMQAIVEMYNAPLDNMMEVKRNYKAIERSFRDGQQRIVIQTIYLK